MASRLAVAQSPSGTVRDARTEEPLIGATIRPEGTDIGAVTLNCSAFPV